MFRSALRFAAGAAVATALWVYATPIYNRTIAATAEPLVRIDGRLRNAEIIDSGRRLISRGNAAEPHLPGVLIPADELTYNIILLAGLFATNPAPFRDRSMRMFSISLLILFATHVLATVVSIEATYATQTVWGRTAYSAFGRGFWRAAEFAYRLAGMFGIAFGCWWMTRVSGVSGVRKGRG